MTATDRGGLNEETPRAFDVMIEARKESEPLMDKAQPFPPPLFRL
jgi:hypothetical protein